MQNIFIFLMSSRHKTSAVCFLNWLKILIHFKGEFSPWVITNTISNVSVLSQCFCHVQFSPFLYLFLDWDSWSIDFALNFLKIFFQFLCVSPLFAILQSITYLALVLWLLFFPLVSNYLYYNRYFIYFFCKICLSKWKYFLILNALVSRFWKICTASWLCYFKWWLSLLL